MRKQYYFEVNSPLQTTRPARERKRERERGPLKHRPKLKRKIHQPTPSTAAITAHCVAHRSFVTGLG